MSDYTNSGKLYKNRNKREPKHPDYTSFPGVAKITCPHCQKQTPWKMAAWLKNGTIQGTKFMSIAFKVSEPEAPAGLAPAEKPTTTATAPTEQPEGDIPF